MQEALHTKYALTFPRRGSRIEKPKWYGQEKEIYHVEFLGSHVLLVPWFDDGNWHDAHHRQDLPFQVSGTAG